MGNIPVTGGNQPETNIRWADGQKQVESGDGSRLDIYENGEGRPDGPGHDHYWATFNKKGDMTGSGGHVD